MRLASPRSSRRRGRCSTSPTTTSSAPPSRATSAACRQLAQTLYDRGDIYKGHYEGWYCVPDETYWAEDQLARGHTCPQCGRAVEFVREDNYFFKLSAYQDRLLALYEAQPGLHPARDAPQRGALSFVKGGLRDLSISRANVKWGIPLPWDETHTMYVWFDALINYITAVGYGDPDRPSEFERRWPAQIHFVGKDIIRFHCVIWPAMLMAAGLPVPESVFAHGFLLTKGEKMSKSQGQRDGARRPRRALRRRRLPLLLPARRAVRHRRLDLARGDGAALQRRPRQRLGQPVLAAVQHGRQVLRRQRARPGRLRRARPTTTRLREHRARVCPQRYAARMDALDYAGALEAAWDLVKRTNRYIEDSAPWNLAKSEETHAAPAAVLYNALEAVRIAALFTRSGHADTSAEVWRRLGLGDIIAVTDLTPKPQWGRLPVGNAVVKGEPLFPRIVEDAE